MLIITHTYTLSIRIVSSYVNLQRTASSVVGVSFSCHLESGLFASLASIHSIHLHHHSLVDSQRGVILASTRNCQLLLSAHFNFFTSQIEQSIHHMQGLTGGWFSRLPLPYSLFRRRQNLATFGTRLFIIRLSKELAPTAAVNGG